MGNLPSVIGPYRVVRQLGEGGMGAVFEAVHEVIQRRVAIKVLHPEAGRSADTINRFINEARAANLVDHPGLVQITDFGNLPDGAGYLVMEYLKGETLSGRLAGDGGKLSPSETVQIGIQIAAAVAAVHKKNIIHRDLKPSNVMLVPEPAMPTGERVKVLDFGLAKLSEARAAAVVNTNSQAVMGTHQDFFEGPSVGPGIKGACGVLEKTPQPGPRRSFVVVCMPRAYHRQRGLCRYLAACYSILPLFVAGQLL